MEHLSKGFIKIYRKDKLKKPAHDNHNFPLKALANIDFPVISHKD